MEYQAIKDQAAKVYGWTGQDATAYAFGYLAGREGDKESMVIFPDDLQAPAWRGYSDGTAERIIG